MSSKSPTLDSNKISADHSGSKNKNKNKIFNSPYFYIGVPCAGIVLLVIYLIFEYSDKDKKKNTTPTQRTPSPPGQNATPTQSTPSHPGQNANPENEMVDCVGSFGAWSQCSPSCGVGTSTRTYTIQTQNQGTGSPCPYTDGHQESSPCNSEPCSTATPDPAADITAEARPCDSIQCNGDLRRKKANAGTVLDLNIDNDNDFNSNCCEWNTPTSFTPEANIPNISPIDGNHRYRHLYNRNHVTDDYYAPNIDSFNRAQNYPECPTNVNNHNVTDWSIVGCKGYNIINNNGEPDNFSYITSGHETTNEEDCNACKCPDNYFVQYHGNLVQFRCVGEGDFHQMPFHVPNFE